MASGFIDKIGIDMTKKILLLLLIVFAVSCKEDPPIEIEDNDSIQADFILVAGQIFHDSIRYFEFSPQIVIKGQRYGTDSNYYYNDSLEMDLNLDGINDLKFRYLEEFHQPSCSCEEIDCCMPSGQMRSTIKRLSDIEIAVIQDDIYQVIIPARFAVGDTIKNHTIWDYSSYERLITAWGLNSPWDIDYFNSFIGYRFLEDSDTIYGWIRMNTANSTHIEIYDYVIESTGH